MYTLTANSSEYSTEINNSLKNRTGLFTENGESLTPVYLQVIIIAIYGVIICLAIGGNGIVCYVIITSRRMRTAMNLFIVNLACGDLFMAVFCIPFSFISNLLLNYWAFGSWMCPLVLYCQGVFVFVSSFTLLAICIDRYVAIIHPLRRKLSKKQALIAVSVIWILSLMICLPTAVTARLEVASDDPLQLPRCYEVWTDFSPQGENYRGTYTICVMVVQYFIPLLVFIFTYGRVSFVMWVKKIPGEAHSNRDQKVNESKKKIIKMMIMVVVIYALCWLPLHLISLIGDAYPSIYGLENIHIIWLLTHWLAMSNSCYNPFIYCWMNARFRDGFKQILCCQSRDYSKGLNGVELRSLRRQDTFMSSASSSYRRPYFRYMSDKITDYKYSTDKVTTSNVSCPAQTRNISCPEDQRHLMKNGIVN